MQLSIILPVHNEEENILSIYSEIKTSVRGIKDYEIIFVDDGSRDQSFKILKELSKKDSSVKVIRLKSNYGQSVALRAGMDFCKGEKIITLDADGQHDPRFIPLFFKKLDDFDVVCNIRKNRNTSNKLVSSFGNFLIRSLFRVKLKDSIGGMKGFTRQVKENIYLYGNMHRYLPLMALWKGFKVGEQEIALRKRIHGKSKYSSLKGIKGLIDLLTIKFFISYSSRPSYIFGSLGFLSFGVGAIAFLYLALKKLIAGAAISNNLPLFLTSILLILLGFNFIFFGFIGDMISYNHMSQSNQKNYLVSEVIS